MIGDPTDKAAKAAIQDATGTPATQLRGLTAGAIDALQNFAAKQLSVPLPKVDPQPSEIKSTTTIFHPANIIPANEQPLPTDPSPADIPKASTSTLVARYVDVSGGSPVTATGTFVTP